jgi:pectate lyase
MPPILIHKDAPIAPTTGQTVDGAEDTGKLRVTYYNNYWKNVNSRGPSLRFGTGHIFNSVYDNVGDGIKIVKRGSRKKQLKTERREDLLPVVVEVRV